MYFFLWVLMAIFVGVMWIISVSWLIKGWVVWWLIGFLCVLVAVLLALCLLIFFLSIWFFWGVGLFDVWWGFLWVWMTIFLSYLFVFCFFLFLSWGCFIIDSFSFYMSVGVFFLLGLRDRFLRHFVVHLIFLFSSWFSPEMWIGVLFSSLIDWGFYVTGGCS